MAAIPIFPALPFFAERFFTATDFFLDFDVFDFFFALLMCPFTVFASLELQAR